MAVFSGNGSATSPSFTFSSDTNTGIFRPNADELALVTNGAQRLTVSSTGDALFNFEGAAGTAVDGLRVIGTPSYLGANSEARFVLSPHSGSRSVYVGCFNTSSTSMDLTFGTSASASPTEKARITSTGNLLIGGTLPSAPNARIDADGELTAKRINGAWEYYDESPSVNSGDTRQFTIVFPANNRGGLFKFELAGGRNLSDSSSVRTALVVYFRAFTDNSTSPGIVNSSFGEAEIYAHECSMASNFTIASSGTGDGTFTVGFLNNTGAGFIVYSTKITYIASRGDNVTITAAIV